MNILTIFLGVASAGVFGSVALACGSSIEAALGTEGTVDGGSRDSHALWEDVPHDDSREADQAQDAGHADSSAEQAAPGDAGEEPSPFPFANVVAPYDAGPGGACPPLVIEAGTLVDASCPDAPPPPVDGVQGVYCGGGHWNCEPLSQVCCVTGGSTLLWEACGPNEDGGCGTVFSSPDPIFPWACLSSSNCSEGEVCCASRTGSYCGVACDSVGFQLCASQSECPAGQTCEFTLPPSAAGSLGEDEVPLSLCQAM
jgi:hypothetical protein